jgi:hypothetical protein
MSLPIQDTFPGNSDLPYEFEPVPMGDELAIAVFEQRDFNEAAGRPRFDTPFDKFMYEYVGHPILDKLSTGEPAFPALERAHPAHGTITYNNRRIGNGSIGEDGTLLHIRQPDKLLIDDPTANYFPITSNIYTGIVREWYVSHARTLQRAGQHTPDQVLVLSEHAPVVTTERPPVEELLSPLARGILRQREQRITFARQQGQPRIILSTEGTRFEYGGSIERFSWIAPFAQKVGYYEQNPELARNVLAEVDGTHAASA